MISYITTSIVVVAAALAGSFKLPLSAVISFCFTLGVTCLLIGLMEIKAWTETKRDILVIDGGIQLFTGVIGLMCGIILL